MAQKRTKWHLQGIKPWECAATGTMVRMYAISRMPARYPDDAVMQVFRSIKPLSQYLIEHRAQIPYNLAFGIIHQDEGVNWFSVGYWTFSSTLMGRTWKSSKAMPGQVVMVDDKELRVCGVSAQVIGYDYRMILDFVRPGGESAKYLTLPYDNVL